MQHFIEIGQQKSHKNREQFYSTAECSFLSSILQKHQKKCMMQIHIIQESKAKKVTLDGCAFLFDL